jgi:hypothetical protein
LDWRPIFRDTLVNFYAFAFLIWVFPDGKIDAIEASVGVGSYFCYIALMAFNKRLMWLFSWLAFKLSCGRIAMPTDVSEEPRDRDISTREAQVKLTSWVGQDSEYETDSSSILDTPSNMQDVDSLLDMEQDDDERHEDDAHARTANAYHTHGSAEYGEYDGGASSDDYNNASSASANKSHEHESEAEHGMQRLPTTPLQWIWSILSLPYLVVFKYEPERERARERERERASVSAYALVC